MKLKRYILQGFFLLLCTTEITAGAPFGQVPQDPQKPTNKKPRIQTSASEKETIFKPQAENGKKVTTEQSSRKETAIPSKEVVVRKKKADAGTRNSTDRYIALKTNIAYDAIALPNLALEIACSKHISVELPLIGSFWDVNQKHAVRTIAIQPEGRWWLKQAGAGHFFGVHANIGWFNVKWNDNRYQSDNRPLLGAGLSYGYLLPLSDHWGAEFTLGAGYAHMKYNTYYNIDNGAQISSDTRNYWGITRVGLSLSYRF